LRKTRHERIKREREDQMLREKKLMIRCIEMREDLMLRDKTEDQARAKRIKELVLRNKR
jgi:hypothetical protein